MGRVKDSLIDELLEYPEWDSGSEGAVAVTVPRRVSSPFRRPSVPVVFTLDEDGPYPRARDLFMPENIQAGIAENHEWLQDAPRTSRAIQQAIFPVFLRQGMTDLEILEGIGCELFEAGYRPDHNRHNPTWIHNG